MDEWDEDYDIMAFQPVSLCRDRLSRPETLGRTGSFTEEQLDSLAPLRPVALLQLREINPSPDTIRMVERRIRAAHFLKYGGGKGET